MSRLRVPAYRKKRTKYNTYATVTLTDSVTKKRREICLGEYDSQASREMYARAIADWEAAGQRIEEQTKESEVTIDDLVYAYWTQHVENHGYSMGQIAGLRTAYRLLRFMRGATPASDFGPNALRNVRDAMVSGDPSVQRKPWCRSNCNKQVNRIRQMFKWASAHELVPVTVYQALVTLEPLKRGRCDAIETDPVKPAPIRLVRDTQRHTSRQVAAMIDLQLLTGMRSGEVCKMRTIDIDRSGAVWVYELKDHKTAHHGKSRKVYLGPKAQGLIDGFLTTDLNAYLFSPADAEQERRDELSRHRKTPASCGNTAGSNRTDDPVRPVGYQYTPMSYGRAIQYAIGKAFDPPVELARQRVPANGRKKNATRWETADEHKRRLGDRWGDLLAWRKEHHWHPHQLRHNYATMVRKESGIEAAQIMLGHSSATVTEIYAERDAGKAIEIAKRMG